VIARLIANNQEIAVIANNQEIAVIANNQVITVIANNQVIASDYRVIAVIAVIAG